MKIILVEFSILLLFYGIRRNEVDEPLIGCLTKT